MQPSLALAQLPQRWACGKYFHPISVGDVLLAGGKCFVSDAGVCNLVSDR
jgi:hypothetical protein